MENREKEFDVIIQTLKQDYGWDLNKVADKAGAEALLDYAIKAIKTVLINTPQSDSFLEGVKTEAAHQIGRWGIEQEATNLPHDYSLVIDKLKGKQALAIWDKDTEKYKHHLITLAAVCLNAHNQLQKEGTTMNRFFYASLKTAKR